MKSLTGFNSIAKAFTLDVYKCTPTPSTVQLSFQKNSGVKQISTMVQIQSYFKSILGQCFVSNYFLSELTSTTEVKSGIVYTSMRQNKRASASAPLEIDTAYTMAEGVNVGFKLWVQLGSILVTNPEPITYGSVILGCFDIASLTVTISASATFDIKFLAWDEATKTLDLILPSYSTAT